MNVNFIFAAALPYFTKTLPESAVVYEADDVELTCEVSEPSSVIWYRNSVEIPAGHEDYTIVTGISLFS